MRRASLKFGVAFWLATTGVCAVVFGFVCEVAYGAARAQQVTIDRIVARVDTDIILLSDVRALERYQQLVDGKSETDAQVLDRLIDQWVVRNEADTAQFPHPTPDSIDKGVERVQKSFTSPEEYETKKKDVGL